MRTGLRLLPALLLAALLAACGGAAPPAPAGDPTAPPAAAPTAPPAAVAPQPGGSMVIAQTLEPDSLDPQITGGGDFSLNIISLTSGSLLALDPGSGDYVPYLAESYAISEDGLTYTFTLRDDVKFHDGTPVTAADWVYAFERMKSDAGAASLAGALTIPVTGYEAPDPATFVLKLDQPFYALLYSLVVPVITPSSRAAVEAGGVDYGRNPVGTGPYKVKEYITGDRVVLERNPDFTWGPAFSAGKAPLIAEVQVRIIPEEATILAGLEAGEIDVAAIQAKDADVLEGAGFQIYNALSTGMPAFVGYLTDAAPFDDVRVRQALNLAVDRESMVKVVLQNFGQPQYGPLSPRDIGYSPLVEQIAPTFDLARAQALLDEAGITDGDGDGIRELGGAPWAYTLKLGSGAANGRAAEVLKDQYKALGLELTIQQLEDGVFYDDFFSGNYELALAGFGFGDADLMWSCFYSGGDINFGRVNDPTLDPLLDQLRTLTDSAERQTAAEAAQKLIVEQAYFVPLYTDQVTLVVSGRVQGASFANYGDPRFGLAFYDAFIAP